VRVFISASFKRTATITQTGAGSPTLRSGTVAFYLLRCAINVAYTFASAKVFTVTFVVGRTQHARKINPVS